MFRLRDAQQRDLDDLQRLARLLDTLNFPDDRAALSELIAGSTESFAGNISSPDRARYLFVLEDVDAGRLVGASMIIASHGTTEDPHSFLRLDVDERYSATLRRLFRHQILSFQQSYTPHTEIGALILDPAYRSHPDRLGRLLSFVRFLYIGLFRDRFRERVQAELLPPFEPDGSSRLWEWFGRKFTGLDYREADRLSRENREFIQALFPRSRIYTALIPDPVREVLGAVGPQTRGVARMLAEIGFAPNGHIDPFDGGPHFEARTAEIALVRGTVRARYAGPLDPAAHASIEPGIVARLSFTPTEVATGSPRFCATPARCLLSGGDVFLDPAASALLGLQPGEETGLCPLRVRSPEPPSPVAP